MEIHLILWFVIYSLVSSLSLIFCVDFCDLKQLTLQFLADWFYVGDELCQSTQPNLLVGSQTFVIVQAAIFVLHDS